ncbi:MAG TPA: nucleotide pyrophosphatase/phosphodiesterase family protein [Streptosporangiaceae bacterium]|nr:nucleotide pyrophosphatase/phosphodiesterase family protein [Streptosporangiaceae bacterium]
MTAAGIEDPDSGPVVPRYGENTLADLSDSLLASLGVPGASNPLGLAPADRVCVLLVDGLGWELLRSHRSAAPFLAGLVETGCWLTAGFPSTTATSLGSLGTARPPGQHGLLGYQVRVPETGRLLNALRWDKAVDPIAWQPGSTIFDRCAAAGVSPIRVAAGAFRNSGLSVAAMRGADYRAADSLGALVACTVSALAEGRRALAVVYTGDLDATGHAWGCTSPAWRFQLPFVDRLAEQLAAALPARTALYVTADHGMVDVPASERIDADAVPELREAVALLAGEGRARHVYAVPGAAADVLAHWQATLGDSAWVVSRDEAIEKGWFGPVAGAPLGRIGDVIAAMRGRSAVVATRAEPRESALVGMHGSLTPAEQRVPLLGYVA